MYRYKYCTAAFQLVGGSPGNNRCNAAAYPGHCVGQYVMWWDGTRPEHTSKSKSNFRWYSPKQPPVVQRVASISDTHRCLNVCPLGRASYCAIAGAAAPIRHAQRSCSVNNSRAAGGIGPTCFQQESAQYLRRVAG
jgi:hypothetical protein